jgi:hypothetical protein
MLPRVQRYEKLSISMLNNFLTIGFRAKTSISRVKKVIPDEGQGQIPLIKSVILSKI